MEEAAPEEAWPSLGREQAEALEQLRSFWQSPERELHVLKGYAGTGKSTLCVRFLSELPPHQVRLCAPTNKAVKVLEELCEEAELDIVTSTAHRLLKLVPTEVGDRWLLRQVAEPNLEGIRLLVVDECSMVGEDLWSHLQELPLSHGLKILLMGDEAQLPPVAEGLSPSFALPEVMVSGLREVFRQGQGSPILAYSLVLREAMQRFDEGVLELTDLPLPAISLDDENMEIRIVRDEKQWEEELVQVFSSDDSKRDEDWLRVLSYTNARVERWNQLISQRVYPKHRGPFHRDQVLVLTSPVTKGGWSEPHQVLLSTGEQVRMLEARPLDWRGLQLWELDLQALDGTVVSVIHLPRSMEFEVDRQCQLWREERAQKVAGSHLVAKWRRRCVGVQPASALTIHRSQGSSFGTVYLDWPSLRKCRDFKQSLQLIYVAVTRARRALVIFDPED